MTNHSSKFNYYYSSEVVQLQDCRQVNSSTDIIENAPPIHNIIIEPTSYEHSETSNTSTEKNHQQFLQRRILNQKWRN